MKQYTIPESSSMWRYDNVRCRWEDITSTKAVTYDESDRLETPVRSYYQFKLPDEAYPFTKIEVPSGYVTVLENDNRPVVGPNGLWGFTYEWSFEMNSW